MSDRSTTTQSQTVVPTAALLTPDGRGAVATVRIRGDRELLAGVLETHFRTANNVVVDQIVVGRAVFGHWGAKIPEGVVVCRVDETTFDVHCHGGTAPSRRILNDLQKTGIPTIPASQLQRESIGRFRGELLETLCATRTLRTADIVLEQSQGLLGDALQKLQTDLDDPTFRNPDEIEQLTDHFDSLLRFARFGRHLTQPWRVVLTGRPNVGKSSLLNALAGFSRSIVFHEPGTTRDVLTVETAFDGWPVELIDTAGIRESEETLEATGIERARSVLQSADCRVLLLDVSQPLTQEDDHLLKAVSQPGGGWGQSEAEPPDAEIAGCSRWSTPATSPLHSVSGALVIAHKSDLPTVWDVHEVSTQFGFEIQCVSSKTNIGLDDLQAEIVKRLVPEIPPPGTPIPVSSRQIELLRDARKSVSRGEFLTASRHLAQILE